MFRRILVPLDGSRQAEQLLPYVRTLASGLQCRVDLLQVIDLLGLAVDKPTQASKTGETKSGVFRRVESYLGGVAKELSERGLETSTRVIASNPAFEIINLGEQEADTLVVMPTHSAHSTEGWPAESITAMVLHGTVAPVLVVPTTDDATSDEEAELASVMVSLDGSPVAEQALPYATALANAFSLDTTLLTITPSIDDLDGESEDPPISSQDAYEHIDAHPDRYLAEVSGRLREQGLAAVEERVVHGSPADAILQAAGEMSGCLLVMASHGRSEIERIIIGSVTDEVARRAVAPVLVIRGDADDA